MSEKLISMDAGRDYQVGSSVETTKKNVMSDEFEFGSSNDKIIDLSEGLPTIVLKKSPKSVNED
jgi:hypothetical protein